MTRNIAFDPVATRSTNPAMPVMQPVKQTNTAIDPACRYYTPGDPPVIRPAPTN